AVAVLLLTARWTWPGDVLTFAMPWIAAGALVLALTAALLRAPGMAIAAGAVLVLAAMELVLASGPTARTANGPLLRVATFNTLQGTASGPAFLDWVTTEQPDVIVLQEFESQRWNPAVAALAASHPYRSALTANQQRFQ